LVEHIGLLVHCIPHEVFDRRGPVGPGAGSSI
jgi:hypothetical protein